MHVEVAAPGTVVHARLGVIGHEVDGRRSSHSLFRRAQVDEAYPIAGCRSVPAPPYLLQYLWTIQREAMMSDANVFVGKWTYRSWLNDVNLATSPNDLLFGSGTIDIVEAPSQILKGTIGGSGWQLDLHGSRSYGHSMTVRFHGKGTLCGSRRHYGHLGY